MVETEGRQVGDEDTKDTSSSAWASGLGSREAPGPVPQQECIACTKSFHQSRIVRTTCDHNYCNDCIRKHFEEAMKDESGFPPKCCTKPIPLDLAKSHLSLASIRLFKEKTVEFSTSNRTYCSREACNAFIYPDCVKDNIATCQNCHQRTCANCKRQGHEGDCHEDEADKFLIKTASEKGWQRCLKCRRMVERSKGCNQMT
jgi:IBR domain, a half RING-finger domain